MLNSNLKLVLGVISGIIVGGIAVVGANQSIQAIQNDQINISLNGHIQSFKDETTGEVQYPITYNNRTYLPLRNIASLSGLKVDYDSNTNVALLNSYNYPNKDFNCEKSDLVNVNWLITNSKDNTDTDNAFMFKEDDTVTYYAGWGQNFVGTYGIKDNKINIYFNKALEFEYRPEDEDVDFSMTMEVENKNKLKITSCPYYIYLKELEFIEPLGYRFIENSKKEYYLNKAGEIYERYDNVRSTEKKNLEGIWYLGEEFMPEHHSVNSCISFKDNRVSFIGFASYNMNGGYFVDGDIVELYLNEYSALNINTQSVNEQVVRLKIVDGNKLVVIKGATDVLYENSDINNNYKTVINIRDLNLKEGYVFTKQ